jgi:hypothetical protein
MSRYSFNARKRLIIVGWDNGLRTFFAQVWEGDDDDYDDDNRPILWLGLHYAEVQTVKELVQLVAPYGAIPRRLKHRLQKDFDERPALTEHQLWLREVILGKMQ